MSDRHLPTNWNGAQNHGWENVSLFRSSSCAFGMVGNSSGTARVRWVRSRKTDPRSKPANTHPVLLASIFLLTSQYSPSHLRSEILEGLCTGIRMAKQVKSANNCDCHELASFSSPLSSRCSSLGKNCRSTTSLVTRPLPLPLPSRTGATLPSSMGCSRGLSSPRPQPCTRMDRLSKPSTGAENPYIIGSEEKTPKVRQKMATNDDE